MSTLKTPAYLKSRGVKQSKSKAPNVYTFLKFVNKRILSKQNKPKIDLLKCFDDPNSDKNSKVYNNFLQVMLKTIESDAMLLKQDFMNEAMN
jgi:hypothetical protein